MDDDRPYLNMDGQYFGIGHNDIERRLNIQEAVAQLRPWCMGEGNVEEAAFALQFIEQRIPKVRSFCTTIRQSFAWDSAVDDREIRAICGPAFNGLCGRL